MVDDFDTLENPSSRGPADYWAIAARRRWVILLPLFLCWAIVWSVSWLLPSVCPPIEFTRSADPLRCFNIFMNFNSYNHKAMTRA